MKQIAVIAICMMLVFGGCNNPQMNSETGQSEDIKVLKDEDRFTSEIASYERESTTAYSDEIYLAIKGYNGDELRTLLLRDLMEPKLIAYAKYLSFHEEPIMELAQFFRRRCTHTDEYLESYEDISDRDDLKLITFMKDYDHNFAVATKYKEVNGAYTMRCAGFISLGFNVLTWMNNGVIPSTAFYGYNQEDSQERYHAYGKFTYQDYDYLIDNHVILKIDGDEYYYAGVTKDNQKAYTGEMFGFDKFEPDKAFTYNSKVILDDHKDSTLVSCLESGLSISDGSTSEIEPSSSFLDNIDFGLESNDPYLLSKSVFLQLYQYCNENTTDFVEHAKYAYHTKLVRYPEYYIKANFIEDNNGQKRMSFYPLMTFNQECETVQDLVKRVAGFEHVSIYQEDHRIMMPEYILLFNQTDRVGAAILMQTCLEYRNLQAYSIVTDESSYSIIFDKDIPTIFELSTGETVSDIEGDIEMILSSEEVYYPLMERNSMEGATYELLSDSINQLQ